MFAASMDRRFIAERLLYSGLWVGGLLAWGQVVGERSEPARPVPAASPATETDWRGLNAELAELAGEPRTAVGGR